jgi:hypothetical protein
MRPRLVFSAGKTGNAKPPGKFTPFPTEPGERAKAKRRTRGGSRPAAPGKLPLRRVHQDIVSASGTLNERRSGMRSKEQYIEGLSKMKRNLYFDGRLIDRPTSCRWTVSTPSARRLTRPPSPKTRISVRDFPPDGPADQRFTHDHQNTDDLHKKQDMTRMLCQKVGGCIQRCMGSTERRHLQRFL